MQDFLEDLSNWYLRRSRERFWKTGMDDDKLAAKSTEYAEAFAAGPTRAFTAVKSIYNSPVGSLRCAAGRV